MLAAVLVVAAAPGLACSPALHAGAKTDVRDRIGDPQIVDLGSTLGGPLGLDNNRQGCDLTGACRPFSPRSEGANA